MIKKFFYLLIIAIFYWCPSHAQIDTIRHRIFLIGDAGELMGNTHPVIDWLKKNVDWNDERNTAIYLGDNIYPHGLPTEGESDYKEAKRILDYQIDLVKGKKAKAFFIPGNHDWGNGKIGGWQRAVNQTDYINSQQLSNVQAWPLDGCPGPIEVELDSQVVVVLMDSHWFLHVHDKPGPGSGCQAKTIDEFTTELSEIVSLHPDQLLIMAMHHPIHTHGVHGGVYNLKHHIFPLAEAVPGLYIPLPVLGSIYPLARGIFGNIQDVNHPAYRAMANAVDEIVDRHPFPIAVSGHDHSLQFLQHDSMYQIVSGSGAKITRISKSNHNKDFLFADVNPGFSVIEVSKSGMVSTKFYNIKSQDYSTPTFAKELRKIVKTTQVAPATIDTLRPLPDSITVIANAGLKESFLKNLFMGKSYRPEWTQKVTVPVLDLGNEAGGLRPVRKGGGKQTKSLRLEDSTGKEWALRSIQKFPEAAIPADLRQTVAKDIVEQGISASYPYASLSISPLAKAAGLPPIRRKLLFVPDDPRLDRFRTDFKNTLAVLEEREPINVKKTYNTDELVLRLAKDNDDHIDQKAILKARLLDNFIMDFDRHEDQWRWATRDTGKGKIYYPIPRDHDQAFFINRGIIPYFVRKPWTVPEIQGFRANADNIKTFNKPARNFDRYVLTELSEDDWRKQIDTFLTQMTDEVIEQALNQQPDEVRQFAAQDIIATLKERRTYFMDDMMEYYRFISKEVNIVGSNQKELFTITKNSDGSVHVVVHKIEKTAAIGPKIYDRTFDPNVTDLLEIYGLSEDDKYVVEGGESTIKIRLIGGPGNDEFANNGTGGKVLLYDALFEENKITGNQGLTNKFKSDPQVNRYDRLNYRYDLVKPGIKIAYNVDDGIYLGGQVEVTKQGFRKDPYRLRHYISASRALRTSSYRFTYEGDFIKTVGEHDLLLRGDVRAPINVTNFFGLGNESVFDENKPGEEKYYRARYNSADASILLRRQLQSWMRVNYGLTFEGFRVDNKENEGKYVNETGVNGLDPATLYKGKTFIGPHLKLDINSKNNPVLPTRGFTMDLNVRPLFGLNTNSGNLTKIDFDMRVYASLFSLPRFVVATRLGYGRIIGDFDFPQAYYLSGTENLRGYRRDRFGGRIMAFNNTEVRIKLLEFSTYLFPGSFGVLAFNDVGRVWMDGENSTDWHVGNGAGIWVAPIRRFVITALATRSKEEKLIPMVTFGYSF